MARRRWHTATGPVHDNFGSRVSGLSVFNRTRPPSSDEPSCDRRQDTATDFKTDGPNR